MSWRCFGGLCQKALLANASTASLTGLRRFLAKPATSPSPESEQRLAGYADNPRHTDCARKTKRHNFAGFPWSWTKRYNPYRRTYGNGSSADRISPVIERACRFLERSGRSSPLVQKVGQGIG